VAGVLLLPGCDDGASGEGSEVFKRFTKAINRPFVRVKTVATLPKIDGQVDESYTAHARPMKFVFIDGTAGQPKEPTTAYVVNDKENLYVAVRCEKPDPGKLVAKQKERDGSLWRDECVDITIDPANTRKEKYFHITVNPLAVTYDARDRDDTSWNPRLEVKCGREAGKAWIVEVKIPFSELGVKAGAINRIWSFNVARTARDPARRGWTEESAWSPTGVESTHVPEMFGYLWMEIGTELNR
jgi:hypothetical protein